MQVAFIEPPPTEEHLDFFNSPIKQLATLNELNILFGLKIPSQVIPSFIPEFKPQTPTETLQLVVNFSDPTNKNHVQYNFDKHLELIEKRLVNQQHKLIRAFDLKTKNSLLKSAYSNDCIAKVYWVGLDYYHNLTLKTENSSYQLTREVSKSARFAGPEILDLLIFSPKIVQMIDGINMPSCYLAGYRIPDPEDSPFEYITSKDGNYTRKCEDVDMDFEHWRNVPCALWDPGNRDLILDCSYWNNGCGWWTMPTVRSLQY